VVVASGIVLPGDGPLPVQEVVSGLYVVALTHERDLGFFSESPLYAKESAAGEDAVSAEDAVCKGARSSSRSTYSGPSV
jgi:hypothetical protein